MFNIFPVLILALKSVRGSCLGQVLHLMGPLYLPESHVWDRLCSRWAQQICLKVMSAGTGSAHDGCTNAISSTPVVQANKKQFQYCLKKIVCHIRQRNFHPDDSHFNSMDNYYLGVNYIIGGEGELLTAMRLTH